MLSSDKVLRIVQMLAVPSAVSIALVLGRFAYVADLRFRFCGLLLNLLLAWIPMVLALVIWRLAPTRRIALSVLFVVWLLFFPNAFYITTDLIHDHKFGLDGVDPWYDILMTACFAVSGMFLGSFALYVLHVLVRGRYGRRVGWLFAGVVLALGSYGIYLGRFLRLNSWDALLSPEDLFETILAPGNVAEMALFCGGFFLFSLLVYSFIVSAAHLQDPSKAEV